MRILITHYFVINGTRSEPKKYGKISRMHERDTIRQQLLAQHPHADEIQLMYVNLETRNAKRQTPNAPTPNQ